MSQKVQSFENHAKLVPMFHGVLFVMLLVTLGGAIWGLISDFSLGGIVEVILAVSLLMLAFWARFFALGVQDRVIRLEEQLRMERVLSAEMHSRIPDISTEHRIGLRFASDAELSGLVQKVLNGELSDRAAVKQAVQNWRADDERI